MENVLKMEEEVLERYKTEEADKGACTGRGEPLEWRIIQKEKKSASKMV